MIFQEEHEHMNGKARLLGGVRARRAERIPGPAEREALELMAREEGIFLDPVYTGKAFSWLLAQLRSGALAEEQTIVFLHSGGAGGLFAIDLP